jgi:NTE family protein
VAATNDSLLADLVFEGGGVKGIGLAGAYRELSDSGYQPGCVAGTSAGAIMAALVAAGYTGAELEDIVLHKMSFAKFEDGTFLDHFGPIGDIAQFFKSRGMHSGNYFRGWIRDLLAAKGKTRFGDLRNDDPDPKRAYKLQVIASDLSARSMLVLPQDAEQLGTHPDELEIAEAIRMSMSIPVFFQPVSMNKHEIVDGGLLSNFPVWLFDTASGTAPRFPTFGLLLVAPGQTAPLIPTRPGAPVKPIGSDIDFLKAIAETMMEAHDRFYVEQANYARTIPIPTMGVGTTEFDISAARASQLFESGRNAARAFLATWDFEAYKARFRQGAAETRRESVSGVRGARSGPGSAAAEPPPAERPPAPGR